MFFIMRTRTLLPSLLSLLFLSASLAAAQTSIETVGPFSGKVPDAVTSALAPNGVRATVDGKVVAEIWPAKSAATEKNSSQSALYPNFGPGMFYGVISLPNGGGDYRGQKVPAGVYTLRYELLPSDGNHMGAAPNPDFFLLVPADADPGTTTKLAYAGLVKLSAKASGTAHPAAFSLTSPEEKSPSVMKNDQGHVVVTFTIPTASGAVNVGMIVLGSAEQ